MKIEYIRKDITTVSKGMVLHGCNCSGGFGSGVAGAIKKTWPKVEEMFREYPGTLGQIQIVGINNDLKVINGFTQQKYGYDGKVYADIEAIKKVIKLSINACVRQGMDLYMPKIGCGLGGLNWEKDVQPLIKEGKNRTLDYSNLNIYICEL